MGYLPPEIWATIFSYSKDPYHLWNGCRPVSHSLRTGVEIYIRSTFLTTHLRLSIEYRNRNIDCRRATFMRYSPDHRRFYFDITCVQWSSINSLPTDQMQLYIIRHHVRQLLKQSKEQWLCDGPNTQMEVYATYRGESESCLKLLFCMRLADAVDTSLADNSERGFLFELDLENMVISFDWKELVRRTLVKSTGSEGRRLYGFSLSHCHLC